MNKTPNPTTTVWVLAYTLSFPEDAVEIPQVCRVGHLTEQQAEAARYATGSPMLYRVCKVEVTNNAQS